MKTIIIDSFYEASKRVLEESGFEDLAYSKGPVEPLGKIDIIATLGLVGELKGHLVLRMSMATAISFVDLLSGHLEIKDYDAHEHRYRKAAVGEICNQIGGRSVALLSEQGIDCLITFPTVISGEIVSAALPESDDRAGFSIKGSFGTIFCEVALKNSRTI